MQDARGQKRADRDLVGRDHLKKCAVCGKHFIIRRKGWACSKKCLERLNEGQDGDQ
jgi:hypothetical protein